MAKAKKSLTLESVQKRLSVRVAELRTSKGTTQVQLADSAGLEVQYLRKIEQGDRAPSLKTLVALASALGTSLAELFNFEDREIVNPRVEVQLLRLRSLLAEVSEDDVKLLNKMAERLAAGPVLAVRQRKKGK